MIEGTPLVKCPNSTEEFYKCYPGVVEKGLNFAYQSVQEVEAEFSLYISQGEFGVVPGSESRIKVVGSDDATTCHIVVIRHPSGTVGVAHFDGSSREEAVVNAMVDKIEKIENGVAKYQLSVVGGYLPEKGSIEASKNEAERLSLKILSLFIQQKSTFELSLWCTCRLNSTQGKNGPQPRVYGVGVDIYSGALFSANFKSHEPDLALRSASRWMSGEKKLGDLYDHTSGTITIEPFYYSGMDWFGVYLQLPDEVLLNKFSTSPKVEPPQFCQDLRKVFRVFIDHPHPQLTLFPNNRPKKYIMNGSGLWELLKEKS